MLLREAHHQPLDDAVVEVFSAQVRVAAGGDHVEDAVADFEHRDVERPAAEVEHRHLLFVLLATEPVRQRGGSRLVDDADDVESGDLAGVLGRVALAVVEVRRAGNHGF